MPLTSQVYQQTYLFGQAPALANRSAKQENERASKTSDTSGLYGSSSLSSANLQSCLESRLQALLEGSGSTLFALTWKHWDMQSQPPICALRGLVRRTSDKDSGLVLSGWPTPRASENVQTNLEQIAHKGSSWLGQGRGATVATISQLTGWPTGQAGPKRLTVDGRLLTGSCAKMASGGRLSPEHSRWLMGYPPEWGSFAPTETPLSLKRQRRSSERSSKQ